MPNRSKDWLKQANHDLELARHAENGDFFDWACFAAQQSAEKAVKAVIAAKNGEVRGHAITHMTAALPEDLSVPKDLVAAARRLDRHYIPTRCPNGFDRGAPLDYFTAEDSSQAIADAEAIVTHCTRHIS